MLLAPEGLATSGHLPTSCGDSPRVLWERGGKSIQPVGNLPASTLQHHPTPSSCSITQTPPPTPPRRITHITTTPLQHHPHPPHPPAASPTSHTHHTPPPAAASFPVLACLQRRLRLTPCGRSGACCGGTASPEPLGLCKPDLGHRSTRGIIVQRGENGGEEEEGEDGERAQ